MDTPRRVLVVDHSKVVRSALAKHLRGRFDVREEADGESAWHTLVLDPSIIAIVTGTQLPRLSCYDLLARLRASKLRRLCDIPFLLVVSGNESEADRLLARQRGVTDFVTRGMARQEVVDRVGRLVDWDPATNIMPIMPPAAEPPPTNTATATSSLPSSPTPLSDDGIRARLEQALAGETGTSGMVSALVFGLDNHDALSARFGKDTVAAIAAHVAQVLQAKIGQDDSIGHAGAGRCRIISPGGSQASCVAFAQRVCRGLANSQVTIAGEAFKLLVSAGVASIPADGRLTAAQLTDLAELRLAAAQRAGGGQVCAESPGDPGIGFTAQYFSDLVRYCNPETSAVRFGAVGLHLMPLFKALDREFRFGLPLSDLERSFEVRAREEGRPPQQARSGG